MDAEQERTAQIMQAHPHHNGWEHLHIHKPARWDEIVTAIGEVDERGRSMEEIQSALDKAFVARNWKVLETANARIDFRKDRTAVQARIGGRLASPFDLFARHMAFYVGDVIDVGVEILPMKAMSAEMSSGSSCYEGELRHVIRQGRGVPAVPPAPVGIAPWQRRQFPDWTVTVWQKVERVFYDVDMNERPAIVTPIASPRAAICPNCGGPTDRPYLDCSRCRAQRWRMTPAERRATWASFPGLDESEPISLDEARAKRRRPTPSDSEADKAAS